MDKTKGNNIVIKYPKVNKKSIRKRTLKEIYNGKNHNSPINKKKEMYPKKTEKKILRNIVLQIYMII